MKPRQTRIKITTNVSGEVVYMPQHKGWIDWYDFDDYSGNSTLTHTNPWKFSHVSSTTLKSAQEQIDNYLEAFDKEEVKRNGSKVVKTEYVKYP